MLFRSAALPGVHRTTARRATLGQWRVWRCSGPGRRSVLRRRLEPGRDTGPSHRRGRRCAEHRPAGGAKDRASHVLSPAGCAAHRTFVRSLDLGEGSTAPSAKDRVFWIACTAVWAVHPSTSFSAMRQPTPTTIAGNCVPVPAIAAAILCRKEKPPACPPLRVDANGLLVLWCLLSGRPRRRPTGVPTPWMLLPRRASLLYPNPRISPVLRSPPNLPAGRWFPPSMFNKQAAVVQPYSVA